MNGYRARRLVVGAVAVIVSPVLMSGVSAPAAHAGYFDGAPFYRASLTAIDGPARFMFEWDNRAQWVCNFRFNNVETDPPYYILPAGKMKGYVPVNARGGDAVRVRADCTQYLDSDFYQREETMWVAQDPPKPEPNPMPGDRIGDFVRDRSAVDVTRDHPKVLNPNAPGNEMPVVKQATVTSDVDVYDAPGGNGKKTGILRAGQQVTTSPNCKPEDWCDVSGDPVPGGSGWVWGALKF